jgi:2,3-bisphosphoglycerate-independent phosphoglycerate mutase
MTDPTAAPTTITPVVLLILDGVGCSERAPDNAISRAAKLNRDRSWREHAIIDASELPVGLPCGKMGRSEVGHLGLGLAI